MPVTTCTMNATSVALPKTYHQFDVPRHRMLDDRQDSLRASRDDRPVNAQDALERSSSRVHRSADLQRAGSALHVVLIWMRGPVVPEQRPRRRPAGDIAVGVVDAAVARAQEQVGVRQPVDRAAQVRAVDGEDGERRLAVAPHIDGGVGGLARPGQRRGVFERDLDCRADLKSSTAPTSRQVSVAGLISGLSR